VSQAIKCEEERKLAADLEQCKAEASRYCLTADCVLRTTDILHHMDLTIDPCDDFWLYSCGGWLHAHKDELVDRESWGVEDEMKSSIRQYFRRLLESPAQCDDDYMTTDCKMRLMYARCMDTDTIDAVGAKPLQDILDDFGGWSALGQYYVIRTTVIGHIGLYTLHTCYSATSHSDPNVLIVVPLLYPRAP